MQSFTCLPAGALVLKSSGADISANLPWLTQARFNELPNSPAAVALFTILFHKSTLISASYTIFIVQKP